ncbi:ectoine/hydroxyectoine ABC transporter substrate-binding protein EhuB [Paenalcaligenes hominis]|uniref:Ectoine/hydroxyectoine ABC transporter substrate-binding protein EhuB n=1 Tax=Paenalcaligenes hominis TaxID=643674 RepID=A0A1U9JZ52_9BURK|nr:ectoine/hydroxyectoine ABC transporter substrate-binding protein EhuB [Paenalcaligenes hominis]AQS51046.1 ectoine/hydroxyectoine ABC transporter substrate-binding protein EhuB [Paenalcaligenes hominis]
MRLFSRSTLLCGTAATLLTLGLSTHAASLEDIQKKGTIRIAVANEIPYGYTDLNGEAKGVGPEVAMHLVKALGIDKIEWQTTNFGSLIPGLQADRFDMVAAEMAILPQRCEQILFSEPNSSYGEGLLVAAGNPKDLHSYEAFKDSKNKVAIMAGADQLEMMQALGVDESQLVTISNNADAISTVATGRADAYAATGLTAAELAKQSDKVELAAQFEDPVINGEAIRSWGGFTFAKDSESLRDAINKELAAFKQTKEWQEILSRYGFSDVDQSESNAKSTADLCMSS